MFTIIIQEKGGEQRRMVFNKPEVTIGRVQGNDIVLPKGNVSKRHARIVLKDGKFIIVDLKSTNGTYVNGRKITSPLVVKDSDKIYIGDFIVGVDEAAAAESDSASEPSTAPPERAAAIPDVRPPRPTEAQPMPPSSLPMTGGVDDRPVVPPPARGDFVSPSAGAPPLAPPSSRDLNGPSAVPPMPAMNAMAGGAPAQVVPIAQDKARRGLVGAGARRVVGRSVSLPSRRGVHL